MGDMKRDEVMGSRGDAVNAEMRDGLDK